MTTSLKKIEDLKKKLAELETKKYELVKELWTIEHAIELIKEEFRKRRVENV